MILRKWHKNSFHIPKEVPVNPFQMGFKTADNEIYLRDNETSVIRHAQPKIRGKRARKQDKINRRKQSNKIILEENNA